MLWLPCVRTLTRALTSITVILGAAQRQKVPAFNLAYVPANQFLVDPRALVWHRVVQAYVPGDRPLRIWGLEAQIMPEWAAFPQAWPPVYACVPKSRAARFTHCRPAETAYPSVLKGIIIFRMGSHLFNLLPIQFLWAVL